MTRVKILDKEFETSISEATILESINEVAKRVNHDLKDENPLMLCVLNGAFMFAADLMKAVTIPCQISFVKVASYNGTSSTGSVKQLIGLNEDIKGRSIVLVEDIIDTGVTIKGLKEQVVAMGAKDVRVATLLFKPESCMSGIKPEYIGLTIPNDFIVGYGLDYDGYGRNLRDIYTLVK
ncbi:MAG: hypoxanthine phosphoribosyltransferase [Marinilabiliaceae bacterium]|nr:hypoxanthine phosphoribosyltransferase [Marinilabiliaceae bacterium]